ncbi:MFS transporter [Prescottella agglutinans]|uniref:Metabolite-proton symporter n=1 Tax=Prescottella agglutinans TaxID=1644129 RepID=A0ABT6M8Y1_9NOCA|nr:MFS transporter [Prescottella agglutinans]MDH6280770.1 metabolite-proton symporter [Prescottella agglutinans]
MSNTDVRVASPAAGPTARERRKVLGASFIGTAIEWYDFFLYGAAASLIFGPQFFPSQNPLTGTLAAFATFAVGFVARPIGGIVMGHFGDRVGRKRMLLVSMFLMGGATIGIGLLPNYASIGVLAPILLVTFRFVQGLGVGGEWGGAVLMAVEYAPPKRRAVYGAFPQMGLPAGIIAANIVFIVVTSAVSPATFSSWGWRVPFLLSGVLILVALFLRAKIEETPSFRSAKDHGEVESNPLTTVLRKHGGVVALAGAVSIACPAIGYLYSVYVLSYGTKVLGIAQSTMLWLVVAGAVVQLVTIYMAALLAERFGQRQVFLSGALLVVLWAFPFFLLIDTAEPLLIFVSFAVMLLASSLMAGPQAAMIASLFPSNVRYSGTSIAYQIGSILGGGFAPLIATSLYARFGSTTPTSLYLFILGLISLIAIVTLRVRPVAEPANPQD